nr:hypothetical protein [Lachnospiraceae bacterium]
MEIYKHYDGTEEKILNTPAEELAGAAEDALARAEFLSSEIAEADSADLNVRDAAFAALRGKEEVDEYAPIPEAVSVERTLRSAEEVAEDALEAAGKTASSFQAIAEETTEDAEDAVGAAAALAPAVKAKAAKAAESMDMTAIDAEIPAKAEETVQETGEVLPEKAVFFPEAAVAAAAAAAAEITAEPVPEVTAEPVPEVAAEPVPEVPEIPAEPAPVPPVREEDLLQVETPAPAPEPEPPVTTPSRISRKTLTIGLICLAVVLLGLGAFLMTRLIRHPLQRAADAAWNTAEEMDESALGTFAKNLRDHGSVTLKVDLNEMQELISTFLPIPLKLDAAAEVTVYSKYGSLAAQADAVIKGKSIANGQLIYNEGKDIAISSDILLGKTNYGLNLKTINSTIEGSVLDPAKGGVLGSQIPQELFDYLKTHEFKEHELEETAKEGKTRMRELTDHGVAYLIKNAKFNNGSQTIDIAGESIKTGALTVTFNDEVFCGLLETLIQYCRENKDIRTYLIKTLDGIPIPDELFVGKTGVKAPETPEEQYDQILDMLDEQIAELKKEIAGTDFTAILYTKDGKMLRADGKAVKGDREAFCSISVGPDVKAIKEIDLELNVPGDAVISALYEVKTRSDDLYDAKLTVRSDAADLAALKINWDKKTGALSVLVQDLQGGYFGELSATLLKNDKVTTLDLQKVSYSDGTATTELPLTGIHLTFSEAAEFPALSNFTEITSMSEDQIASVLEDLEETISSLFSLSSLFGQ